MKGDRPRPFTNAATACGMPRNAAAFPRIDAPSTIRAIIEQVTTDPMTTSRITCCDSDPWPKATSAAPSTPTAAAPAAADSSRLRRGRKAAIHRAEHACDQKQSRCKVLQRSEAFAPGDQRELCLGLRHQRPVQGGEIGR